MLPCAWLFGVSVQMGACCCCCRGKDKPEPIFTEDKDRKCTDVLCLLLFIVFWGGMVAIAAVGFSQVRGGATTSW